MRMISLTTMIVQLINHETDGIRICRLEGESLVTVVIPREKLSEAKRLPKLPHRGIYYLLDENHGVLSRVYAGQTTQGISRLEAHRSRKDFWNTAVMFLDDEDNIDRDVLDSLEARAIEYVRTHGSYETDNVAAPSPRISPYKEERVANLHEGILFRMKALGLDLDRTYEGPVPGSIVFHTTRNGVRATGRYNEDTGVFTVLAGSAIALSRKIIKNQCAAARRLELFGDSRTDAILESDQDFSSPSSAAVFVLGGSANGWVEWVDEDGHTLDSVYRSKETK